VENCIIMYVKGKEMKGLSGFIKLAFVSFFFLVVLSCSDSNYFDGVLSVNAFGNWPNFNGAVLKANKSIKGGTFTLSPKEFFVNIRTVKIKSENGEWISVLENGDMEPVDINVPLTLVAGSYIPPDVYTSFLIGVGENWYAKTVYSTNGIDFVDVYVTNSDSTNTLYFLFTTPVMAKKITNEEKFLSNYTISSIINSKGYPILSGEYKYLHFYFDTINSIEVLTNVEGLVQRTQFKKITISMDIK